MPLFLFWYILRDLLKLLVVSTTIMVIVISFGAAIQPLSEGLIGPIRIAIFILLAMPPMLQFALPFSAAFSATIVYHRMSQDNELSACASSGVPYTHLLLPAATLGITLTIGLSLLTNYICPRFWEAMNRTAHLDAPEFFIRSVQRGESIAENNMIIRAEGVERVQPPPGSNAYASLRVYGLVVMVLNKGQPEAIGSAPQGVFNLTQVGSDTVVTSAMQDLVVINESNKDLLRTSESQFEPMVFPSAFRDSPKFMDLSELQELVKAPEEFSKVEERIDDFRQWLAQRELYLEIDAQLRSSGRAVLSGRPAGEASSVRVEVFGSRLGGQYAEGWTIIPPHDTGKVRVVRYQNNKPDYEIESADAKFDPRLTSMLVEPSVTVTLDQPDVRIVQRGVVNKRKTASFARLYCSKLISEPIRDLSVGELALRAKQFGDEKTVTNMGRGIEVAIRKLHRNILSRIHERTALSVSCFVMMLLGSTLAIRLRNALPLAVYFWSFVPAIIGLVLISAGSDLLRSVDAPDAVGLLLTWSGNLLMATFVLITLRQVSRT